MAHQVRVHRSCICNEYQALHNRHLIDRRTDQYDASYIGATAKSVIAKLVLQAPTIRPVHAWDVIKAYHGPKRAAYVLGHMQLKQGFNKKMAHIKMFVKPDKYDADIVHSKAPRAIQFRKPAFNLALAKFLKPFEHWFYHEYKEEVSGLGVSAKGLNQQARAKLLQQKIALFDDPVYMLLDHSKFDSCVTVDHFRMVLHKTYLKIMPSYKLRKYLNCQVNNFGRTSNGLVYKIKGTRMSGDFDTALGNTLLNYITIESLFVKLGVRAELLIDGDDSVVVLEKSDLHLVMENFNHFSKWGFTTECQIVEELSEIEFCRSKYLRGAEPNFARDPFRALSNMAIGLKRYQGKARLRYLAGNALGEMHRSNGVPVIFPIAKMVYEKYGKEGVILDTEMRYKLETQSVEQFVEPTDDWRVQFAEAWGIPVPVQLAVESEARQLILSAQSQIDLLEWQYSLPKSKSELIERYASQT